MQAKFRETLWFKRGELVAPGDPDGPSNRERPVEDRYLDDGSVTGGDVVAYSVRTGGTRHLPRIGEAGGDPAAPAELAVLIGELKRGRRPLVAALGASLVTACVIVLLHAL